MSGENRIRKLYKESGLTYDEISSITGVKPNTLSCWINGQRTPPDYVISFVEERVTEYLSKGREYIDKEKSRDAFVDKTCNLFSVSKDSPTAKDVIDIFDSLPTVIIKK